jgi:hypothetical protein
VSQPILALVFAGALAFGGGCRSSSTGGVPDAGETAAQRARHALGAYVEGYNLLGEAAGGLAVGYERAVPREGPSDPAGVRLAPVPPAVGEGLARARQEFEQGKATAPDSLAQLIPLAARLRATARRVVKTYTEAQHYYQAGQHADDGGAGARQYHQEMLTRVADFRQALTAMAKALDALEQRQMQAEIDALAAEKGPGYWFRRGNQAAKRAVAASRDLPGQAAAFAAEVAGLSLLQLEMRAAALPATLAVYQEAFGGLRTTAGRLQALSNSTGSDAAALEAARLELSEAFNRLIEASAALYDLEAQPGG